MVTATLFAIKSTLLNHFGVFQYTKLLEKSIGTLIVTSTELQSMINDLNKKTGFLLIFNIAKSFSSSSTNFIETNQ